MQTATTVISATGVMVPVFYHKSHISSFSWIPGTWSRSNDLRFLNHTINIQSNFTKNYTNLTQQLQALVLQPAVWGISCLVLLLSPCNDSSLYLSFSNNCKATAVTHTKRIDRNFLRKETSFVCCTSSVLRKSRHMKQKEKITHCC